MHPLKNTAKRLSDQASFLVEVASADEHKQALELMDELIDDYDDQQVLIELLSTSIKRWGDTSNDFAEFNQRIAGGDPAVSVLRMLMDQNN